MGIRNFNLWKSEVTKEGKIGLKHPLMYINLIPPLLPSIVFAVLQLGRQNKLFVYRKIIGEGNCPTPSPQPSYAYGVEIAS